MAEIANINSPEQIAISGPVEAINKACTEAKTKGAKRAILLKVGGAFHSSLMKHAQAGLEEALAQIKINEPKGTFIPNVLGESVSEPNKIKVLLGQQLTRPVQWVKTMESIVRLGINDLMELGPGRVLKGLARKTNSVLNVMNVEISADLEQLKPIFA